MTAAEKRQEAVHVRLSKKLEQLRKRVTILEMDREYYLEMCKRFAGLPAFDLKE